MNKRSAHVRRDRVESTGTNDVNAFGLGLLVVLQLYLLQELGLSRDVNVMSAPGKAGLDNLEILAAIKSIGQTISASSSSCADYRQKIQLLRVFFTSRAAARSWVT